MKILGISGSPRKKDRSGAYKLVQTVLENTGCDYDFISLKGRKIAGCIACLGCVKDNVCKVEDDLAELRDKIVEAEAYVIGAPNYYSTFNAATHAFLERWFQFRHQEGTAGQFPADEIEKFFLYNFIETVAKVSGQGAASCFTCGYGETCKVGIPNLLHGEGVKITEDIIPDVTKQPDVMATAVNAGKLLGERLRQGNDRTEVAQKMQEKMMAMFESAV